MKAEQLNNIKDYLIPLNIQNTDKKSFMDFYKKMSYIETLMENLALSVNEKINMGYGDFNSKVCFIFKDRQTFEKLKDSLQKNIEIVDVHFWQVYTTYVSKTSKELPNDISILMHELNAIKPQIIYLFDENDEVLNKLNQECAANNIPCTTKQLLINPDMILNDNTQSRKDLWKLLKFLVNYKK